MAPPGEHSTPTEQNRRNGRNGTNTTLKLALNPDKAGRSPLLCSFSTDLPKELLRPKPKEKGGINNEDTVHTYPKTTITLVIPESEPGM